MSWADLPALTLSPVGAYVALPSISGGGKIGIKIPAFAQGESGEYEIGIFSDPNTGNPGFVDMITRSIQPYARFLLFDVPANLPEPVLGMRISAHPQENPSYLVTAQFQPPTGSYPGNASLMYSLSFDDLAAELKTRIQSSGALLSDLQELQEAFEAQIAGINGIPDLTLLLANAMV